MRLRTLVSECVGSLVSKCVEMLVSERIEDAGVGDEIEDAGVRACRDSGTGEDRDEIKIRIMGVGTLMLECVDESGGEIWNWRREIAIGTALK